MLVKKVQTERNGVKQGFVNGGGGLRANGDEIKCAVSMCPGQEEEIA